MRFSMLLSGRRLFLLALLLCSMHISVFAQEKIIAQHSHHDLAKKAANPIANLISLPFQLNINLNIGDYDRTGTVLNIMPTIPFSVSSWNVINRIIIPVRNAPDNAETGSTSGLGNTNYSMMFVPPRHDGSTFQWGFGPAFNIPTASDDRLGVNDFAIGPAIIALVTPGNWVMGITANNVWSYREGSNVNQTFIQYFITYNIANGWYINTNPMLTANQNALGGAEWIIPVGAGGGKVFKAGGQPMKLQAQFYYNVERPTGIADWTFQVQYVLLFPG